MSDSHDPIKRVAFAGLIPSSAAINWSAYVTFELELARDELPL